MATTTTDNSETKLISDETFERQMISALISDPSIIKKYGMYLTPDTFTIPDYVEIYDAMVSINESGKEVGPIELINELKRRDTKLDESTILSYALPDYWMRNAKLIAQRLQVLYKRRKLKHFAQVVDKMASNETIPLESIHSMMFDYLSTTDKSPHMISLGEAMERLMKRVEANANGIKPSGCPTGLSMIDEWGGFHEGEFIVVAGDTGSGKTSFALSMALTTMLAGEKMIYYSMEMDVEEISARIFAVSSEVPASTLLYSKLSDEEYVRFVKATEELPNQDCFYLDDDAYINFDNIISSIISAHHTLGIKGAIVDFLQLLNFNESHGKTQEELMATVARRLKNLAQQLKIWIVGLSQLNRDSQNVQPTLYRLRGSGQIAEAADVVMLIYRPEMYGMRYAEKEFKDKTTSRTALIDVAKGRNIGTGKFLCHFNPELTHFYEADIPDITMKEILDTAKTAGPQLKPEHKGETLPL